jgi:hypothetical protein
MFMASMLVGTFLPADIQRQNKEHVLFHLLCPLKIKQSPVKRKWQWPGHRLSGRAAGQLTSHWGMQDTLAPFNIQSTHP